jgi:iron complex transport system substrate-binding protein
MQQTFTFLIALVICHFGAPALAFPVEVQSCFDRVTFDGPPKRPVVNDFNMVQTIIDMGLIDRFVGVAGIAGGEKEIVAPPGVVEGLNQFSDRYPTTEAILGQNADFYFAGWQYGLSEPDVTPQRLASAGVKTYVLYESCIRIGPRPPISMDAMYADILALRADRQSQDAAAHDVLWFLQQQQPTANDRCRGDATTIVRSCGRQEHL